MRSVLSMVVVFTVISNTQAIDPKPITGGGPYVKPCTPADLSWTYYGLNGGGPYITTVESNRTLGVTPPVVVKPSTHKPSVAVYGPVPAMLATEKPHVLARTRGLGWGAYLTPSPR